MYLEIVLVLFPVTVFEVLAFLSFIDLYDIGGRSKFWILFPLALMVSPLIATWRLCIAHASRGIGHARSVSRAWWFMATAGAGLPLMGITAALVDWSAVGIADSAAEYHRGLQNDPFGIKFVAASAILTGRYAVLTAPILLPLIHLWWDGARSEGIPASQSNQS